MSDKGFKMNYKAVLVWFALIPLLVGVTVTSVFLIENSKKEIKDATFNYMVSLAETAVENLDWYKIDDGDNFLKEENLIEEGEGRGLKGFESSYIYIVDAKTGEMLWHPTAEKIGKPVENDAVKQLMKDIKAGKTLKPDVIEYEYKGEDKYAGYCIGEDNDYIVVVTVDAKEVLTDANSMVVKTIIMDFVIIVFFLVYTLLFANKVVKPLGCITNAIKSISEGDLNSEINEHSVVLENDILLNATKILQDKLHEVIGKSQSISEDLKTESNTVTELAEASSVASNQISTVVEGLSSSVSQMANNVQDINEQTMLVGENIEEIAGVTKKLVSLSNDIKSANSDATEYIKKVAETSNQSVQAVDEILTQVNETNKAVLNVQEAVGMIQSVAEQTKLLALNASIEAARAGESGKGFAVVATEIGKLSTQSNESAKSISDIVKDIIEQSEHSVGLSSDVEKVIVSEQSHIVEAQKKFEILNDKIELSLGEIDSIYKKVDTLNSAKEQIIVSVTELSAISEENAAETEEVSASVTDIAAGISNINASSQKTNEFAIDLNESVSYFS